MQETEVWLLQHIFKLCPSAQTNTNPPTSTGELRSRMRARSWCLSHQRKMKGIQWKWRAARCILPIAFSHQVTCSLPLDTLKIRRECLESRGSHLYAYVMVNKRTQTDGMVFTAESGLTVFRENNAGVLQVCPSL